MKAFLKISLVTCLFAAFSLGTGAQNLIPNPSFEDSLFCPQFYSEFAACEHWKAFRDSPDYIHFCNPVFDLYTNGKQPHTGNAYAGFLTYGITTPDFLRERIGVQLNSPLLIGEKYFVSFFISLVYTPIQLNIASNNIGTLFTTYFHYDMMGDLPNPNYSHINETLVISNPESWIKVSGSFIADSAYTYMAIGNFYDDIYTDTFNLPFTVAQQRAYYAVDDVCVTTDSLYNESWTGIVSVKENAGKIISLSCYPNPAISELNIKADELINSVELFNYLGQRVLFIDNIIEYSVSIPVDYYKAGLYILKISTPFKNQSVKIVIK